MNLIIRTIIFIIILYIPTEALDCSTNPCNLSGYFSVQRGYRCTQLNTDVMCTCPNGEYEINQPCRMSICNRSNPANNPCLPSTNLLGCLETDDFGTTFACLCRGPLGPAVTLSADCNLAVTLTSTKMTTSSTNVPITLPTCYNGGNLVDGSCHCPSGYGGILCQQKFNIQVCERIVCQNGGVCAYRSTNGPTESVCLCRYGTFGEYCELTGTLRFCSPGFCLNNGLCQENVIEVTRHTYCKCLPGYYGIRCENQYFTCPSIGMFPDVLMHEQGKYFECIQVNGFYELNQKSCSKGLRFNSYKNTCTY